MSDATLWRLSASRLRVELLERLFPDGLDALPPLRTARDQSYTLNTLALGYLFSGRPGTALKPFELAEQVYRREDDQSARGVVLCNMSNALRLSGALYRSEAAARNGLAISRSLEDSFQEGISLYLLGLALAMRGNYDEAELALQRSLRIFIDQKNKQCEGLVSAYLAQQSLWQGSPAAAGPPADRAWELAAVNRNERDYIRAARLQGTAALHLGNWGIADERLHHALTRARGVQLMEEELPALVALAELHRQQKAPEQARERLEEIWESAERGPYPAFHADALNVLAQVEQEAGSTQAAIQAATEAYRKAWCDGPPFAYHSGLQKSRKLLDGLGVPELELPAFDSSKFEPMPEVEINPDDEFGGP